MLSVVMGKPVLITQAILLSCSLQFLGLTGEGQKISETNPSKSHYKLFLFLTRYVCQPVVEKVVVLGTDPESMNRDPYYFHSPYRSPEGIFIQWKLRFYFFFMFDLKRAPPK